MNTPISLTPSGLPSRIVLGVTGGVAAYKAAYLARELVKAGASVQVVMTEQAEAFVGRMTFAALTQREVRSSLNDEQSELAMGHIELARWADAILIAPATANTIAKVAHGIADNLLTTVVLASQKPLFIAPAMNQQMWAQPSTLENIRTLHLRGISIIGPDSGEQACGDVGAGRMREPDDIIADLTNYFATVKQQPRATYRVLITAGPTHERIDPVRYIGNQSSGRMGYAIAERFAKLGAKVTLISGPTCLATPIGARRIDVVSAEEMLVAARAQAPEHDIFISVAAIADYRPAEAAEQKIKKTDSGETMTLSLIKNPDILATIAALKQNRPFCVGFAAETQDIERYAKDKLARKNLDMICANAVGEESAGFGDKPNSLQIFWENGAHELPMTDKITLATQLVPIIIEQYESHHAEASD